MAQSKFVYWIELDGKDVFVGHREEESLRDALLRTVEEEVGTKVQECIAIRVEGKRGYSMLSDAGQRYIVVLKGNTVNQQGE